MQNWSALTYAPYGRLLASHVDGVLDLLDPQPGERILDLGCGDGTTSRRLLDRGCTLVAIDSSPTLLAAARGQGIDARLMDAQALTFESEFDAVFSNSALHWFTDMDAALAGVHRALVPGGRFVAECSGAGHAEALRRAMAEACARFGLPYSESDLWLFPGVEDQRERLQRSGFEVASIELFHRPTPLPGDAAAWVRTFGRSFLEALPETERERFAADVQDAVRAEMLRGETWVLDFMRLRFAAHRVARAADGRGSVEYQP